MSSTNAVSRNDLFKECDQVLTAHSKQTEKVLDELRVVADDLMFRSGSDSVTSDQMKKNLNVQHQNCNNSLEIIQRIARENMSSGEITSSRVEGDRKAREGDSKDRAASGRVIFHQVKDKDSYRKIDQLNDELSTACNKMNQNIIAASEMTTSDERLNIITKLFEENGLADAKPDDATDFSGIIGVMNESNDPITCLYVVEFNTVNAGAKGHSYYAMNRASLDFYFERANGLSTGTIPMPCNNDCLKKLENGSKEEDLVNHLNALVKDKGSSIDWSLANNKLLKHGKAQHAAPTVLGMHVSKKDYIIVQYGNDSYFMHIDAFKSYLDSAPTVRPISMDESLQRLEHKLNIVDPIKTEDWSDAVDDFLRVIGKTSNVGYNLRPSISVEKDKIRVVFANSVSKDKVEHLLTPKQMNELILQFLVDKHRKINEAMQSKMQDLIKKIGESPSQAGTVSSEVLQSIGLQSYAITDFYRSIDAMVYRCPRKSLSLRTRRGELRKPHLKAAPASASEGSKLDRGDGKKN